VTINWNFSAMANHCLESRITIIEPIARTNEISEACAMVTKKEVPGKSAASSDDQIVNTDMRPGIEVWPGAGGFADWIAYHLNKGGLIICKTPDFRASPFCGIGYH